MFLSRLEILYGKENIEKLKKAKVLVAGLGGVGGICAEALVRSGVGNVGVIDGDKVEESNLNRQAPILLSFLHNALKAAVGHQRLGYPDTLGCLVVFQYGGYNAR